MLKLVWALSAIVLLIGFVQLAMVLERGQGSDKAIVNQRSK